MELKKILAFLGKYKFAILILALGLLLMAIPGRTEPAATVQETQPEPAVDVAQELSRLLSQVQGAGKVEVLLTLEAGEETLYQYDENLSDSAQNRDTVTVTDGQRGQTGLVRQVLPATYRGAVVVCQGADDPRIRLAIVEAVSMATGLGADRISVLKMK